MRKENSGRDDDDDDGGSPPPAPTGDIFGTWLIFRVGHLSHIVITLQWTTNCSGNGLNESNSARKLFAFYNSQGALPLIQSHLKTKPQRKRNRRRRRKKKKKRNKRKVKKWKKKKRKRRKKRAKKTRKGTKKKVNDRMFEFARWKWNGELQTEPFELMSLSSLESCRLQYTNRSPVACCFYVYPRGCCFFFVYVKYAKHQTRAYLTCCVLQLQRTYLAYFENVYFFDMLNVVVFIKMPYGTCFRKRCLRLCIWRACIRRASACLCLCLYLYLYLACWCWCCVLRRICEDFLECTFACSSIRKY